MSYIEMQQQITANKKVVGENLNLRCKVQKAKEAMRQARRVNTIEEAIKILAKALIELDK